MDTTNKGASKYFTTGDGVKLHYIEAGSGQPVVMVPGWAQTAALFKYQIDGLSDRYHIYAIDMRGHGESAKPTYGYKVQRLSKDLHEFLTALDLKDIVLVGHSMGCSVIWGYFDLFGTERTSKYVFIDEPRVAVWDKAWSMEERANSGAIMDADGVYGLYNALIGPEGKATVVGFVGGMVTKHMPQDMRDWIASENLKFPFQQAATMVLNHALQDWADVLPRIPLPTLVVGGRSSHVNWKSQIWNHEQIKGSRLEIFEDADGGAHFMFLECPDKFNALIKEFVG